MWSHSEDGHAHIRWEVGGLDFALFVRAASTRRWEVGGLDFAWFVRAASARRWEVGGLDFALFMRLAFYTFFWIMNPKKLTL